MPDLSAIVAELRRIHAHAAERASGRVMAGTAPAWAAQELRLGLLIEQLDPAPRGHKREESTPVERCHGLDYLGQECRHRPGHHGGCEAVHG